MTTLEGKTAELRDSTQGLDLAGGGASPPISPSPHRTVGADTSVSLAEVASVAHRGCQHLLSLQKQDGHWCGDLEGCSILESEYLMLLRFLGRWDEPRVRAAADAVRMLQQPDGGWPIYPGGPADISATIKAYFVLKMSGDGAEAPHMQRARAAIAAAGGVDAANSFTKIFLAMFGQYPWERCPAIPPELILLPEWAYFNIYEMSSWSRVMLVPLSIIWSFRPVRPVPAPLGISELPLSTPGVRPPPNSASGPWRSVFALIDGALKWLEGHHVKPLRRRALAKAEFWMLQHMDMSDGLGGIFPPIVNSLIAMECLGYPTDHPRVRQQTRALERLELRNGESLRVQPCKGPVWDTALALRALVEHGPSQAAPIQHAMQWLLEREVRQVGDWRVKAPAARPGGWAFQYLNGFYPDCDDTAQVISGLARGARDSRGREHQVAAALSRGLDWLLSMQNDDGGWAAFDRNCDKWLLTQVPFADHNAMIDPSCPDITGRALYALVEAGLPREHEAVRRAVRFLLDCQGDDGAWFGRWGCNYLYGTFLALQGLRAAGVNLRSAPVRRATRWLYETQNLDGGWGESLASYDDPAVKGKGTSTAAQTAWALLGLFAVGDFTSPAVQRGVAHLLRTQSADGGWCDGPWTGTGFPRVFYLRYTLYDRYFPVQALGEYLNGVRAQAGTISPKEPTSPGLAASTQATSQTTTLDRRIG